MPLINPMNTGGHHAYPSRDGLYEHSVSTYSFYLSPIKFIGNPSYLSVDQPDLAIICLLKEQRRSFTANQQNNYTNLFIEGVHFYDIISLLLHLMKKLLKPSLKPFDYTDIRELVLCPYL